MASDALFECMPMSSGPKPSMSLPILLTAFFISCSTSLLFIGSNLLESSLRYVKTGHLESYFG